MEGSIASADGGSPALHLLRPAVATARGVLLDPATELVQLQPQLDQAVYDELVLTARPRRPRPARTATASIRTGSRARCLPHLRRNVRLR